MAKRWLCPLITTNYDLPELFWMVLIKGRFIGVASYKGDGGGCLKKGGRLLTGFTVYIYIYRMEWSDFCLVSFVVVWFYWFFQKSIVKLKKYYFTANMSKSQNDLAAQAEEQLRLHEKQMVQTERRLDAEKHQQSSSLQDKLNSRLKKKEEKLKLNQEKAERDKLVVKVYSYF